MAEDTYTIQIADKNHQVSALVAHEFKRLQNIIRTVYEEASSADRKQNDALNYIESITALMIRGFK